MIPTPEMILGIIGNKPYREMMLIDNQDTQDIIEAILNKHQACETDYDKFAYLFDGGTVPEICKRLFDFCRTYLSYTIEDTAAQYTSSPATILRRGYSDCKCYALFCGGVLDALKRGGKKISWAFRFASYKLFSKRPYHVFVVVTYQGQEIFIDPVFNTFNFHKPAMWATDYTIATNKPAKIAGMCCDQAGNLNVFSDADTYDSSNDGTDPLPFRGRGTLVGATASQTGAMIQKIAPSLAVVPVVGWIAAAGGELVGTFLNIFGNKYSTSDNVRWLTAKYQYYVLGDPTATSNHHVNEANTSNAQKWFSYVLGVPIYDQYRYHALRGTSPTTGKSLNITRDQRAQNYLATLSPQEKAQVTYDQALAATYPADQFKENGIDGTVVPGAWKNFTAAPSLVNTAGAALPGSSTMLSSLFSNKWVMLALVGAGLMLVLSPSKKSYHGKRA